MRLQIADAVLRLAAQLGRASVWFQRRMMALAEWLTR